jgi:hypothetical protein
VFVDADYTADYQMTRGLREILDADGNEDDLAAFMRDRALTADDHELQRLAEEVMRVRPEQGYLTISPALQWRLQYQRVINVAGEVEGVLRVHQGGN